jgi:hypothetical protein
MLLLVMMVGMALGAILVPMIITQDRATRFDTTRVHAIDAAQAGIDAITGKIRAAVTNSIGDPSKLPCGPISGSVSSSSVTSSISTSTAAYTVTIAYYLSDPVLYPTSTPMLCSTGYGTYDTASGLYTPNYALITSKGTDGNGTNGGTKGRTLVTTYRFKTNNVNIPGGVIRIYPAGSVQYCMDAESATPAVGATVYLETCSTASPALPQQTFVYRSDLTIQLLSSVTTTVPNGLCLDSTPATLGSNIVLNACNALGSPPYTQMWSADDSAHLRGANSGKTDTSSVCINVGAQSAGQPLTIQSCAGGVTDTAQTWVPTPQAGAGQAGASNKQLVNYQQFGRCMDVTNNTTAYAGPGGGQFIILYTCKANPNPSNIGKNQQWVSSPALSTTPTLSRWVTQLDTTYCMKSPKTVGGYVIVASCTSGTLSAGSTDAEAWTSYQDKDATGNALSYSDKYTIKDSAGYCLSLSPNSDTYNGQYYKAIVETCNGSTAQKWNANPAIGTASLQNTQEK